MLYILYISALNIHTCTWVIMIRKYLDTLQLERRVEEKKKGGREGGNEGRKARTEKKMERPDLKGFV